MVGLIFGILRYVKKKTHTNKLKQNGKKKGKNENKQTNKKKQRVGFSP